MSKTIELKIPKTKYIMKNKKKVGENNYIFYITVDIPDGKVVDKYSDLFTVPKNEKEYENKLKYDDTTITDIKVRENALEEVFQNIFSIKNFDENLSKRKELTQTLIKVTLLNNYYSTRIKDDDLVAIARQIVNLGAHSRLNKSKKAEEPDCDLVNQIAYYRKDIKSGDKKTRFMMTQLRSGMKWNLKSYRRSISLQSSTATVIGIWILFVF